MFLDNIYSCKIGSFLPKTGFANSSMNKKSNVTFDVPVKRMYYRNICRIQQNTNITKTRFSRHQNERR